MRAPQARIRERGKGKGRHMCPSLGDKDENQESKETVSGVLKWKAKESGPE